MRVQNRRIAMHITIGPEEASWVATTAEKFNLPVSRVIELCIQSERASISGNVMRGVLQMYFARVEKGELLEGLPNG